eukprot:766139-Hanusia_phi.AAC.4
MMVKVLNGRTEAAEIERAAVRAAEQIRAMDADLSGSPLAKVRVSKGAEEGRKGGQEEEGQGGREES